MTPGNLRNIHTTRNSLGTHFHSWHGTKTTLLFLATEREVSWLVLPSLVLLFSGGTVEQKLIQFGLRICLVLTFLILQLGFLIFGIYRLYILFFSTSIILLFSLDFKFFFLFLVFHFYASSSYHCRCTTAYFHRFYMKV